MDRVKLAKDYMNSVYCASLVYVTVSTVMLAIWIFALNTLNLSKGAREIIYFCIVIGCGCSYIIFLIRLVLKYHAELKKGDVE